MCNSSCLYKLDELPIGLEFLQIRLNREIISIVEKTQKQILTNLPFTLKKVILVLEGFIESEYKNIISNIKLPTDCNLICDWYCMNFWFCKNL